MLVNCKMTKLVFIILSALLAFISLANSQDCFIVINAYYNCLNSDIDDTFFDNLLKNINSVEAAVELIKPIYTEIHKCKTDKNYNPSSCNCLSDLIQYTRFVKWDTIFLNSDNLNLLKQYMKEENSGLSVYKHDFSLTKFCARYEWHARAVSDFKESSQCSTLVDIAPSRLRRDVGTTWTPFLFKLFIRELNYCDSLFINAFANTSNLLTSSLDNYGKFVKCIYLTMNSGCNPLIKRKILLESALIRPELYSDSDIGSYIRSVMTGASQVPLKRHNTYVIGDPHLKSYSKTNIETCNIVDETCLEHENMRINCYGRRAIRTSSATILKSMKITVNVDTKTYEYEADETGLPSTFKDGNSVVTDKNGKTIVKIYPAFGGMVIFDSRTNTHIFIDNWGDIYYLMVRATDEFYASCSGLLVNGCPSNLISSTSLRQSTKNVIYSALCNSVAFSKDNEFIDQSSAYQICWFDCTTTDDESYGQMYLEIIDSLKNLRITDLETVPSDRSVPKPKPKPIPTDKDTSQTDASMSLYSFNKNFIIIILALNLITYFFIII